MSAAYSITLAAIVAGLVIARLILPQLPVSRAIRLRPVEAALLALGVLGLVLHCAAMFARPIFEAVPAVMPLVDAINALGLASVVLYVVPAVLVLVALRRVHPVSWAVLAILLAAVGVTMYNGGALSVHLVAIFVAVIWLALVVVTLVIPWSRRPGASSVADGTGVAT